MSAGSSVVSDVLGWVSIGCWLGAQFPQIVENIRRQSCEGLALPFLFNWLLGDVTNLIGCVLTHQLPFQTTLATYFVSVDVVLFSQFIYYSRRTHKSEIARESEGNSPVQRHGTYGSRFSAEREHHYRELSSAAANVAIAAAALAASEEELFNDTQSPVVKDKATATYPSRPKHRRSSTSITRSEAEEAEDEVDEAALAALADSFHSESGARKRLSWSQERYSTAGRRDGASTSRSRGGGHVTISALTPLHTSSSSTGMIDSDAVRASAGRGRPLQRQVIESPIDVQDFDGPDDVVRRSLSRGVVKARRSSRASQRSVGLVFLGVWALFGIGTLSQSQRASRSSVSTESQGVVLSEVPKTMSVYDVANADSIPSIPFKQPSVTTVTTSGELVLGQSAEDHGPEEPSSQRIIGRVFAWLCTTLYLTSRLPQIWKNFVRKSVEGLSMYLFIFAFLGNTFYVLSILSSPMMSRPKPASTAFLLESMPYLLGSGGTLLFDVTIVSQSFLYRRRPGQHQHPHQHHHHAHLSSQHHIRPHPHAHTHAHPYSNTHRRSSSSRSYSISPVQRKSSVYGNIAVVVPEEEQALLRTSSRSSRSPDVDLEHGIPTYGLGLGLGLGHEGQTQTQIQAHTQTRRRKETSEGGESI